ncbi:MAG: hypothetical protein JSS35_13600, partial [Proteobacteria bacterium]|nr:hypothetical protein [Pseudomonadota bacterium]
DFRQSTEAICALARSADLRARLGAQARARARAVFDWAAVIPQYQALWAEQTALRQAGGSAAPSSSDPFRPDPFRLFAAYPTRHLAPDWRAAVPSGAGWAQAAALLSSPLAAFGVMNKPTLQEAEEVVAWLTEHPGAEVREIAARFPAHRQAPVSRGLLWLARFGVIELSPPGVD